MKRLLLLLATALTSACGGGGGGAAFVFELSGSVPADGTLDVAVDATIFVTLTDAADLATVTAATVELRSRDGTPIPFDLIAQDFNANNIQIVPRSALSVNVVYEVTLKAGIRSQAGDTLGRDRRFCFLTGSPGPTVRPDQVVDLGDRLNVPRFLARAVRLRDGRWAVIGGFTDPATATDTIEVWNPAARAFELAPVRMSTPRAEHTATLLADGHVVIAGGVAAPGGPPLASIEIFDPRSNVLVPGPAMLRARRWHGASGFEGDATIMVTGGFATSADDSALDDGEVLRGNRWEAVPGALAGPTAQHVQARGEFDTVYIGVGNALGRAGTFDGFGLQPRLEWDGRLRGAFLPVADGRIVVIGGDTRSSVIYDFASDVTWPGNTLLRQRRGAHSLTYHNGEPHRFLAAGGFQISAIGAPALATLEVVEYLPDGPFAAPDIVVYPVTTVALPVPFAGHVGFTDLDGTTVLAGGVGDRVGPHSRRVVLILDAAATPPPTCD